MAHVRIHLDILRYPVLLSLRDCSSEGLETRCSRTIFGWNEDRASTNKCSQSNLIRSPEVECWRNGGKQETNRELQVIDDCWTWAAYESALYSSADNTCRDQS